MNEDLNPMTAGPSDLMERTMAAVQNASTGSPQTVVKMFDYAGAFNALTEQKKTEYREKGRAIDVFNSRSIMEFGQEASKEFDRATDAMLNKTKSNTNDELTQLTNALVAEFQDTRLAGEKARPVSWLSYIPWIGKKLAKTAQNEIIERTTVGENIKQISQKFQAMKVIAMTDNGFLEDTAKKIQQSINMSHDNVLTLMVKLDDVQAQLRQMEADPETQLEALQATRMAERRLKRQISNLSSMEYVLAQSMLHVGAQMSNNDDISEIADMSITYLIPIYKLQCAIGATGRNAENSSELERLMKEYANNALVANAKALSATTVKLAELTEGTIYEPEALQKSQTILIDMAREVKAIHAAGDKQYDDMMKDLRKMSQELESALREE